MFLFWSGATGEPKRTFQAVQVDIVSTSAERLLAPPHLCIAQVWHSLNCTPHMELRQISESVQVAVKIIGLLSQNAQQRLSTLVRCTATSSGFSLIWSAKPTLDLYWNLSGLAPQMITKPFKTKVAYEESARFGGVWTASTLDAMYPKYVTITTQLELEC